MWIIGNQFSVLLLLCLLCTRQQFYKKKKGKHTHLCVTNEKPVRRQREGRRRRSSSQQKTWCSMTLITICVINECSWRRFSYHRQYLNIYIKLLHLFEFFSFSLPTSSFRGFRSFLHWIVASHRRPLLIYTYHIQLKHYNHKGFLISSIKQLWMRRAQSISAELVLMRHSIAHRCVAISITASLYTAIDNIQSLSEMNCVDIGKKWFLQKEM